MPNEDTLIEGYRREHKRLLQTLGEIVGSAERAAWADCERQLADFRDQLKRHLLSETVHFYAQLEKATRDDAKTNDFIINCRVEMDRIARDVYTFLGKYHSTANIEASSKTFRSDLATVTALLTKRVAEEETKLFPRFVESMRGSGAKTPSR